MARAALRLSVVEAAAAASVAPNTVNRFETGRRAPIPATLSAIQRAFEGCGVEFTPDGGVRLTNEPPAEGRKRGVKA